MGDAPTDDQLQIAMRAGRRFAARAAPHAASADDTAQDAAELLLLHWPQLTEHYPDGVPEAVIVVATTRRLIDKLRTDTGWQLMHKPPTVVPLDAPVTTDETDTFMDFLASDADVEAVALDGTDESDLRADLEEWVRAGPKTRGRPRKRKQLRTIIRRLGEGATKVQVARELRIDPSRVSQLLAELRSWRDDTERLRRAARRRRPGSSPR